MLLPGIANNVYTPFFCIKKNSDYKMNGNLGTSWNTHSVPKGKKSLTKKRKKMQTVSYRMVLALRTRRELNPT